MDKEIGYISNYEHYKDHDYKKKRINPNKPVLMTTNMIILLIIIISPIILLANYCSNNLDIDLEKEYEDYNKSGEKNIEDLTFGKKNICQYFGYKFYEEVLSFKNTQISILFYVGLVIILLIISIHLGLWERIFEFFGDSFIRLNNNKDKILQDFQNMKLIKGSARIYKCLGQAYVDSDISQERNKKIVNTFNKPPEVPDNVIGSIFKMFDF